MNNKNLYKQAERYRYLGYIHLGVPNPWKPIVLKCIQKIDKAVRPKYIPKFIMNWIFILATGRSVVCIRSTFWYNVHNRLTKGIMITNIKDKYAELRIYGTFSEKIDKFIEEAERECKKTCESCGTKVGVKVRGKGWFYNICKDCKKK